MVGVEGEWIARPGKACVSMSPTGLATCGQTRTKTCAPQEPRRVHPRLGPGGKAVPGGAVLGGLIPPPAKWLDAGVLRWLVCWWPSGANTTEQRRSRSEEPSGRLTFEAARGSCRSRVWLNMKIVRRGEALPDLGCDGHSVGCIRRGETWLESLLWWHARMCVSRAEPIKFGQA